MALSYAVFLLILLQVHLLMTQVYIDDQYCVFHCFLLVYISKRYGEINLIF